MAINQIFNLKNTNLMSWRQGDQNSGYSQWLRDNGVWRTDGKNIDVTTNVYFPADGYYNFKYAADNYAIFSIDGVDLPKSGPYSQMTSQVMWIGGGNHSIRCRGVDTGGDKSCAMIIDDDTQLMRIWNMRSATVDYQGVQVPLNNQPKQDNYCQLLNDNCSWIGNTDFFDWTWMVDFPVDAYYNFRGAVDDSGKAWVDNQPLADISGQRKEYNSTVFVRAGRRPVRLQGKNNKLAKAACMVIEGNIKDLIAAKASADSAKASADSTQKDMLAAKADMDKARWKQVPVRSISVRTSNAGGYNSASSKNLVMNLDASNYTSGNTWTDSNNRFNATLTHGSQGYNTDVSGYFSFDGDVRRANIGMPVVNDMTWIIWFNTTSTRGNPNAPWYQSPMIVGGELGGDVADMGIGMAQGRIVFGMGQPDTTFVSTKSYNDGKWHQLAVTRNIVTGQAQIFVDGALDATHNNFPKGARINTALGIAYNAGASENFQGNLAQIRAYSSVLTLSQIRALYSVHGARFLPTTERAKDPTDNKQVVAYNNGGGVTVSKSDSVSGGGFSASYEVSAYATYNQSASAEVTRTGASVYVGQSYSVGAETTAEVGNEYVGCGMRAWVDLSVTEEAYAGAGTTGNNAYVTAGACYIVRAESGAGVDAHVKNPYGPDTAVAADGCVYTESGSKAEMIIEIGENGAQVEGSVAIGSCVGVEGSVTLQYGPAEGHAEAGLTYGDDHFEAGGGGQATYNDGKVTIGVAGEAAAVVGLDADVSVSVDFKELIDEGLQAYRTSKYIYDSRQQVYNTAVSLSMQAQSQLENLTGIKAAEAVKTFVDAGYQIENGIVKTGGKIADACTDTAGRVIKAVSGGGKIVCTMMNDEYGFGSYRNAIWLRYGANLPNAEVYQRGYHTLFLPLVDYAKKPGVTNHWVKLTLEHIARHRTVDIYLEMKGSRRDTLGQIYRAVLEPLCYITGKFIK